jgi:predicted CXXCH cytochrome family protein
MCPEIGGAVGRTMRITLIRDPSIAVFLALGGTANLFPSKHPVPRAEDIDAAKCLECHGEQAELQSTKKVKKISCLSCHQAHAGGAQARLITDQPPSLSFCSQCHK